MTLIIFTKKLGFIYPRIPLTYTTHFHIFFMKKKEIDTIYEKEKEKKKKKKEKNCQHP